MRHKSETMTRAQQKSQLPDFFFHSNYDYIGREDWFVNEIIQQLAQTLANYLIIIRTEQEKKITQDLSFETLYFLKLIIIIKV